MLIKIYKWIPQSSSAGAFVSADEVRRRNAHTHKVYAGVVMNEQSVLQKSYKGVHF